ncbi:MAG: response regulator [Candidatus Nealsonbacteria bacterium]|nr:response regulator [Candidatus Nealsonbacteria bacterium]
MAKTILIIEDDQFLRELMVRKIVSEGFNCLESETGEGGIEKIKKEKPDLVLLDIVLPGIDGIEVLKKIKEDPDVKSIPVVILSNLAGPEEIERGLNLGAADYLIKAHLTPREIIEKAKEFLK